jgi:hypothetical protein
VSKAEDANQQAPAARLAAKLEAFYEALPEDEKRLMGRIVELAAREVEVEGYAVDQTATTGPQQPRSPIDEFRVNLGLSLRRED